MGSAISTVLFDAGGTLVMPNFRLIADEFAKDGTLVELELLRRAELEIRRDYDRHDYLRKPGDGWLNYCSDLARGAGCARMPADAFERLRVYQNTLCVWEEVMDGVVAALERLRGHFRLGIVSNASGSVRAAFERTGLASYFETIVDSGIEGVEKPDPRIFHLALERMGERADRAAYVGDIYHVDVLGARAAGLRPVLLDLHGVHADKPCERVQSLAELAPLFLADTRQFSAAVRIGRDRRAASGGLCSNPPSRRAFHGKLQFHRQELGHHVRPHDHHGSPLGSAGE